MVRIRNKIIAYILTVCMLLNVVLPNLYVTAWAVDSAEFTPDVQAENFNEILELDNVPVGESVDESTTSQETQDITVSQPNDDLLPAPEVDNYDINSQVDLSLYTFKETISGSTLGGGLTGLVNIYYSYTFTENDKVYNPIYKDPQTGIEYIVITNKAQLQAIGTDKPVVGGYATIFYSSYTGSTLSGYNWIDPKITAISYGDFGANSLNEIGNTNINTEPEKNGDTLTVNVGVGNTGRKYSKDANYLIVNDISLGTENADGTITKGDWIPWDYTGTSIKGEVRTIGSTEIRNPAISNVNVIETDETKKGVGFFGAVYSPSSGADVEPVEDERPWWDIIGNLLGALQGLVTGLLKTLGGLATDIIGSIAGWEDITSLTSKSVSISGLTLQNVTINTDGIYQTIDKNDGIQNNPMPVGGFAGQLSGNVTVSNCKVENLNFVSTNENGAYANKYIGGFVGKTVGATDYLLHGTTSGLSNTLEGLGGVLDSTLNFLLPTDDLVSGLVSKLGISNLVPTKYIPVKIQDCIVSQIDSINASEDHAGGFAGKLEGTQVSNCIVSGISSVSAKSSVGGFAGRISNTVIVGLLQGLGVNLVNFPVGSKVTNCKVEGNNLVVTSTLSNASATGNENALAYAGGFAGAIMASDVIYDGTQQNNITGVTGLSQVVATGSYVGGFAGYAGVGDLAEALNLLANLLNIDLNTKNSEDGKVEVPLGDGVDTLLETVLGVNLNAGVLSLIGLKASQIVGCTVQGSDYSVISSAGSRAGGFIGYLYGGKILEQPIESTYSRVQATDSDGNLLYVGYEAVTKVSDKKHVVSGAVYARLADDGSVIYEDVHGNKIDNISTVTVNNNTTIYNVYDTVFINLSNKNEPALMSSFKDMNWNSVVDANGKIISTAESLTGYPNIAFPVYQQTTTADGYVKFIYNYAESEQGEDVAKQEILYRKDGKYYTLNSDGTYTEYKNVNTEGLTVDALQVSVDDSIEQTGTGAIVTTYIKGLGNVSAQDYVGGVVGQAKLCSAVDLLSNLTVAQYERFEINNVKLTDSNYTVKAEKSTAGGAIGYAMGGDIVNVNVSGLNSVSAASYAGGFAGQIIPGTVAGENNQGLELLGLINVSNLLTVIDAVHTFTNNCSVTGVSNGFTVNSENTDKNSASAGFVAWSINSKYSSCTVSNLASVEGDGYAGGFCAVADSGSIAGVMDKTFNGIKLSSVLGLSKILSVINAIPNEFSNCTVNINSLAYTVRAYAHSEQNKIGERINAQNRSGEIDGSNGSAGGFIGYATAVQIENCSNENLKSVEATSYAGGFGGFIEIGSVAQIGNAGVLGEIASLTGIAALLDCAASMIKSSYCQGTSGGYDITAFDRVQTDVTDNIFNPDKNWNDYGIAGGFVGNFEGSHIEGSYANHINKIQGEQYAGGFVGRMVAGDVAKLADNTSLIANIVDIQGGLLGALQVMVPSIKNSYAKCVPCGGTVLSYGTNNNQTTKTLTKIGIAGGYVGLNAGGQIWGNYDKSLTVYELIDGEWQQVNKYTAIVENRAEKTADYSGNSTGYEKVVYGTGQTCDILQLLKVDATCYAGGYSGYTKAADLASLGDINLLDGLADLSGLLSVGQVVVPTQRNTGVTGPLRNVTSNQMAYFNDKNAASTEKADFSKYYGYTVGSAVTTASGGYNGVMTTGVIENSIAYDLISVTAIEQAGGFAGAILTGGVANADLENSLLGGLLSGVENVTSELLGVVNAIIPVIKTSGVYGYYSGSQITASNGCAGGFVGTAKGGQIWGETGQRSPSPVWQGDSTTTTVLQTTENALIKTYEQIDNLCFTRNLRSVTAKGLTSDAGGFIGYMGAVSIASLGGLGILGDLVALPNDIVTLLSATVPTVYYADVSAVDDWGFYVLGDGARSAGGFAGFLQGAQVGIKDKPVAKPDIDNMQSNSNITVSGLRSVTASDYAGGFFGYANAADTLNVSGQDETGSSEQFTLLQLVTIDQISAIELAKSYIYNGSVNGIADGYRVESLNAYAWKTAEWNEDENKAACAGGFGGLLQAGIVRYCKANDLSLVSGKNYAGGFVARMGKSSILKANDVATTDKLGILGDLLGVGLGVGDIFGSHIQDSSLNGKSTGYSVLSQNGYHNIAGGFVGYADVCRIKNCESNNLNLVMSDEIVGGFMGAMSDSMLLSLDLGLLQKLLEGVTVGLDLIKANRSKIENVTLKGVDTWDGYDIYGGGSSEIKQANTEMGYAGAFIGLNFGSTITIGNVIYADTIKGAVNCINPYFGTGENTALLTNLELDVLLKLIDLKGDLSKSEITQSIFETRQGSTAAPSGVTPETHSATDLLSSLTTPYYVDTNEADLMVENVTHTLTIKKELKYEEGAIANINDLNYEFEIQIWKDDSLIDSVSLCAGDSYVINNPSGTYTIKELPQSVLQDMVLAQDQTVTVTNGESKQVIMLNTITSPPQDDNQTTTDDNQYSSTSGKFIINRIPTGDVPPEGIENPCEILNEVSDEQPMLTGMMMITEEGDETYKTQQTEEEMVFDYSYIVPAYNYLQQHILLLFREG